MYQPSILLAIVGLAACAALITGHLGSLHPALDSASHFRMHLAVVAILSAAASLAAGSQFIGILTLAIAVASTAATYRGDVSAHAGPLANNTATYRLMQFNVHPRNRTLDAVGELIASADPDILVLQESSALLRDRGDRLRETYPHSIVCGSGVPDVAILSKQVFEAGGASCHDSSLAIATLHLDGHRLDVASIHVTWPWPRRQYAHIRSLRHDLSGLGSTAILAGDLNAVPWSHAASEVMRHAGMTRSESLGPTWIFRVWPRALTSVGLPIDHVMSKGNVAILSARKLNSVGSDHTPVLVEFAFTDGQQAQSVP